MSPSGTQAMWAQQLTGPRTFDEVSVPRPDAAALDDGEVLVRVRSGAICGSDLPVFCGLRTLKQRDDPAADNVPGSPMHELVGDVVASKDPRHRPGDRVVGWGSRLDSLAEYAVSLGSDLWAHDVDLPDDRAVIIQGLACVLYAVEQIPGVAGSTAAVLGQGPMGLLFDHVLKSRGARHVTGVDRLDRVQLARDLGADEVAHLHTSRWLGTLTADTRPDVVVEAIGHNVSTLDHALEAAAVGGRVFCFGIPDDAVYPVNMQRLLRKNLTLLSGVTRERRRMLGEADAYLVEHPELAGRFVSHTFDGSDAQKAYELAVSPTPETAKVTLRIGA